MDKSDLSFSTLSPPPNTHTHTNSMISCNLFIPFCIQLSIATFLYISSIIPSFYYLRPNSPLPHIWQKINENSHKNNCNFIKKIYKIIHAFYYFYNIVCSNKKYIVCIKYKKKQKKYIFVSNFYRIEISPIKPISSVNSEQILFIQRYMGGKTIINVSYGDQIHS